MSRKKQNEDDFDDWEEDLNDDEEAIDEEEEIYTCKICGKDFDITMGDDYLLLCDECAEDFDTDLIWSDYDKGKISEEELGKLDLEEYRF